MKNQFSVPDSRTFVYVSNAEDGSISTYRMLANGDLQVGETVTSADFLMPMAINSDKMVLYAASRSLPYALLAYAIDRETGTLKFLKNHHLPDSVPYLSLDRNCKFIFSASYGGHIITVNALEPDGYVGSNQQIINTPPHPHSIGIDHSNRFLFVPCLGSDQVLQFTFNEQSGELAANEPAAVHLDDVVGPRHFAISPDNKFVYVLSEFLAKIYILALDSKSGLLTKIGVADGLPENSSLVPGKARQPKTLGKPAVAKAANAISAADIHLTPNGKFLYISERTGSTISSFKVDKETGQLTYLGIMPTVSQPRGFAIDPFGKFLLVAGERADHVAVYQIKADGCLVELGRYPCGKGANWVEIVSLD